MTRSDMALASWAFQLSTFELFVTGQMYCWRLRSFGMSDLICMTRAVSSPCSPAKKCMRHSDLARVALPLGASGQSGSAQDMKIMTTVLIGGGGPYTASSYRPPLRWKGSIHLWLLDCSPMHARAARARFEATF